MKSLQRKFLNISRFNPYWSSYICFTETIRDCHFKKRTIYKWFEKLVDRDDYDKKDKWEILRYLVES